MNEQPTGQWVYLVRRILAVLVILLLVALLIPHAYQALVGLRGETGLGVQEPSDMGDSDNNGSYDEGASNGVASSVADDVAKQDEDASDSLSSSGQTGVSDGAATASRGRETSEDYGVAESDEANPNLAGVADISDEVAVGEVEQTVPTPVVDVGSQQSSQLILPAEQVDPLELLASAEPIIFEDTITPQDPTYYDYPVYYEEPAYYDYSDYYYEDPAYYDYSDYYYEEQMLEGWYPSGNYYSAAVATASGAQAGGGATAYAAAGGGATAYAAAGGGVGAYAAVSTG
jgi:hypothetical protein